MLLKAANATLLVVDVQERLLPAMAEPERLVAKIAILLKAAEELDLPVTVSEQYPKGLGRTVAELRSVSATVLEKTAFSCWRDDAIRTQMISHHEAGRPLVIVAGVEAHVCVLQTCIDMSAAGFGVFAVSDAMSSRKTESAALAFERMRQNDVQVVNVEMALFELMETAGTAAFKVLSQLIK
jgi:nicotinamidase-related amidase